uniref:Uncharacterized protein n=1 Tax=Anguilla anguilla TaxID=7936 RepID=A0A0E9WH57_ANGAN
MVQVFASKLRSSPNQFFSFVSGTDGKLTKELIDGARERMAVATSTFSEVSINSSQETSR